ncbi:homoserine dehydrogenase [Stachybotrys elegans]|uniref:Homoserine dehydrogenase n=1 Tax=Stachybotrys elegans TaxID=80388 RepID=A0A8K0WTI2_9HYPO|nr:homoserine dehydrogenase [Stachybotrys elegans]
MPTQQFNLAILGSGGVTKAFLPQLEWLIAQPGSRKLNLSFISSSKKACYDFENGLCAETALEDLAASQQAFLSLLEVLNLLETSPHKAILIDNTGAQDVADQYPEVLKRDISIVTPSKKAFAGSYRLWQDIFAAEAASNAKVYIESSVGAGLPMIALLKNLLQSGDEIIKIEGALSGTLSSIYSSFAPVDGKGISWSAAVQKAKDLGFTEPNPRDDLNGLDVARKLIVFARLAGLSVESAYSIPIQSLVPKELEAVQSGEDFLQQLPEFDSHMEKARNEAEALGKVPRYVGSVDMVSGTVKVGPELFDKTHPVAGLKGSDNLVSFYTKRYPSPLILQGAGAGGDVTAMGLIGGIIKVTSELST